MEGDGLECREKPVAKAWLFDMLARVEVAATVEGSRTQSGDEIVIKLKIK